MTEPISESEPDVIDEPAVGFDLRRHKLLCLIVLDDEVATVISSKAGEAFFRAFIVEERATGTIYMNQRFRYKDGDSWSRIALSPGKQKLSRAERVAFLEESIGTVLRGALAIMTGAPAPRATVQSFFPPDPDGDPQDTMDWLLREDLIKITRIERVETANE